MTARNRFLATLVAFTLPATAAFAQPEPATTTASTTTSAATATVPAVETRDSRQVREELDRILDRYPPEVGKVLKLDPTLFSNPGYLANYPVLAAFVADHPEIAHNPRFFLTSVWIPGDPTPQSTTERIWHDTMEAVSILTAMSLFLGVLVWLVRTLIAHRKWSRLSKVQTEVHTKLLDRFGTNEDLMAYIQTPSGKRFLESAPIPVESGPQVSAPVGRILWSVQVGVVLAVAGLGLLLVSANVAEVAQPLFALAVLAISVGAGFVLSAIISYAVSRKLGLWDGSAVAQPRSSVAE